MEEIQLFYKGRNSESSVAGAPVIGLFPEDNVLYRAQVLEVIGNQYKVFYVDFGNVSTINEVWPIEKKFMELPAQALVCSLHGLKPAGDSWLDPDTYSIYFDKDTYICRFIDKDESKVFVNLFYNNEDIAQTLVSDGLAISTRAPVQDVEINVLVGQQFRATVKSVNNLSDIIIALGCGLALSCTMHNLETATETFENVLKGLLEQTVIVYVDNIIDDKLEVTLYDSQGCKLVILNPDEGSYETVDAICPMLVLRSTISGGVTHAEEGTVFIQPNEYADSVAYLLQELFEHYENLTEENTIIPEIDQICAIHSEDGNWYRGKVLEFDDDMVIVQYIDYGNRETIGFAQLRELDLKFKEMCALSLQITCNADGASLIDKDVTATIFYGDNGWEGTVTPLTPLGITPSTTTTSDTGFGTASHDNVEVTQPAAAAAPPQEEAKQANGTKIFMSHIDSPNDFYVQLSESLSAIEQLQADLQEVVKTAADLETPTAGVLCAAPYSIDGEWYRAEVLDADDDITSVRFIDFGNTDVYNNSSTKMKSLPSNLLTLAVYATRCTLNILPPDGEWSTAANNRFEELTCVDDLTAEFLDQDEKKNYVELYANGKNVKDILIQENLAVPVTQSAETKVTGFVSHQNSPSEFWMQLENCVDELEWIAEQLSTADTFPEVEDHSPGTLCAALFPDDMMWYRARVLSNTVAGVELLFIDYGNSCASDGTALRKLPEELSMTPPLAQKCALKKPEGLQQWSKRMTAKFAEISAEGQAIFTVKKLSTGETSIVELFLDGKDVSSLLLPETETGNVKDFVSLDNFHIEKNGEVLPETYRLEEVSGASWSEDSLEKFKYINKEGITTFQIEFLPDNTVCLYLNGRDIKCDLVPPKSPQKVSAASPVKEAATTKETDEMLSVEKSAEDKVDTESPDKPKNYNENNIDMEPLSKSDGQDTEEPKDGVVESHVSAEANELHTEAPEKPSKLTETHTEVSETANELDADIKSTVESSEPSEAYTGIPENVSELGADKASEKRSGIVEADAEASEKFSEPSKAQPEVSETTEVEEDMAPEKPNELSVAQREVSETTEVEADMALEKPNELSEAQSEVSETTEVEADMALEKPNELSEAQSEVSETTEVEADMAPEKPNELSEAQSDVSETTEVEADMALEKPNELSEAQIEVSAKANHLGTDTEAPETSNGSGKSHSKASEKSNDLSETDTETPEKPVEGGVSKNETPKELVKGHVKDIKGLNNFRIEIDGETPNETYKLEKPEGSLLKEEYASEIFKEYCEEGVLEVEFLQENTVRLYFDGLDIANLLMHDLMEELGDTSSAIEQRQDGTISNSSNEIAEETSKKILPDETILDTDSAKQMTPERPSCLDMDEQTEYLDTQTNPDIETKTDDLTVDAISDIQTNVEDSEEKIRNRSLASTANLLTESNNLETSKEPCKVDFSDTGKIQSIDNRKLALNCDERIWPAPRSASETPGSGEAAEKKIVTSACSEILSDREAFLDTQNSESAKICSESIIKHSELYCDLNEREEEATPAVEDTTALVPASKEFCELTRELSEVQDVSEVQSAEQKEVTPQTINTTTASDSGRRLPPNEEDEWDNSGFKTSTGDKETRPANVLHYMYNRDIKTVENEGLYPTAQQKEVSTQTPNTSANSDNDFQPFQPILRTFPGTPLKDVLPGCLCSSVTTAAGEITETDVASSNETCDPEARPGDQSGTKALSHTTKENTEIRSIANILDYGDDRNIGTFENEDLDQPAEQKEVAPQTVNTTTGSDSGRRMPPNVLDFLDNRDNIKTVENEGIHQTAKQNEVIAQTAMPGDQSGTRALSHTTKEDTKKRLRANILDHGDDRNIETVGNEDIDQPAEQKEVPVQSVNTTAASDTTATKNTTEEQFKEEDDSEQVTSNSYLKAALTDTTKSVVCDEIQSAEIEKRRSRASLDHDEKIIPGYFSRPQIFETVETKDLETESLSETLDVSTDVKTIEGVLKGGVKTEVTNDTTDLTKIEDSNEEIQLKNRSLNVI
ncbi:unnamed protein product [Acanthoscelides obtectus]|uniref:Tudor domain-containing protein n=1 Tax=Acanthoscelides obtectus TaxID=200917 RepID=A0A9P0LYP6_ACAOB|nr:unnamed protein product [Acanthoscelides obtectus]CAK1678149.1 Maternal protein tudor [Acanthoscelides obtectus]